MKNTKGTIPQFLKGPYTNDILHPLVFPQSIKTSTQLGIDGNPEPSLYVPILKRRRLTIEDDAMGVGIQCQNPEMNYHSTVSCATDPFQTYISDILNGLALSEQADFCQLQTLFKVQKSFLGKLSLPKSKASFLSHKSDKKKVSLPNFFKVSGVRYVFCTEKKVYVGGFSFVALYQKKLTKQQRNSDTYRNFPNVVALKVTKVEFFDFQILFYSNFRTTGTTIGWLRDFLVQTKLKKLFSYERDLPICDLLASAIFRLTPTTRQLQVFSVLQAGMCDLHSFFLSCPHQQNICNSFDLGRRLKMLHILYQAARSLYRLHNVGLHHGDVKLSNILVDQNEKRALFIDFDGSVFLSENLSCDTYTKEYISPQRGFNDENYDAFKDDTWALGICFLKIITARSSPLLHLSYGDIERFNMKQYIWIPLSQSVLPYSIQSILYSVISRMLIFSECDRVKVGDILAELEEVSVLTS